MAVPPFVIDATTPGDNDIVSQFPANERTMRDNTKSWFLVNHDTNGDHPIVDMPFQSSTPTTPATANVVIYADAVGRLRIVYPDGTIAFVGVPQGTVFFTASSQIPVGYLLADGSAVSRSTYADLFTAIGTLYGAGDGSTTFNLPNHTGRVAAGEDGSGVNLTSTYLGTTAILGAISTGFTDHITLLTTNLPPYTPAGSVSVNIPIQGTNLFNLPNTPAWGSNNTGVGAITGVTTSFAGTAQGGLSTPFSVVQPTIILKALIKY